MRDVISEILSGLLAGLDHSDSETLKTEIEDLLQAISVVFGQLHVESYPADTLLCVEGAVEDRFYIIAKGEVAIYKQISEDGDKDLLARKTRGEFFGEMALVLNAPRSADVITTTESVMLELDRRAFRQATRISDRLANLMSQRTIDQLDQNWEKARDRQGIADGPHFKVFTSYSRRDVDFVRKLVETLQEDLSDNNVTIWMDVTHIQPGEEWDRAVEDALENCDAMLLVLSEQSVESDNVRDEWSYYKDENKHIIPVLMEKCKRPPRLRRYQYVDFASEVYTNALAQLHARILQLAEDA